MLVHGLFEGVGHVHEARVVRVALLHHRFVHRVRAHPTRLPVYIGGRVSVDVAQNTVLVSLDPGETEGTVSFLLRPNPVRTSSPLLTFLVELLPEILSRLLLFH